ncbi:hypothetical protein ACFV2U_53160 [Streptomyces sp. NPDC059697]|uniref:hypothetical protein n=1 Tax=Streptomyces sp. NPDC059697 TaxID=3346912 RepID=UPI0036B646BE
MSRGLPCGEPAPAVALLILIIAGLLRDPLHVDMAARLLPPSAAHPLYGFARP